MLREAFGNSVMGTEVAMCGRVQTLILLSFETAWARKRISHHLTPTPRHQGLIARPDECGLRVALRLFRSRCPAPFLAMGQDMSTTEH